VATGTGSDDASGVDWAIGKIFFFFFHVFFYLTNIFTLFRFYIPLEGTRRAVVTKTGPQVCFSMPTRGFLKKIIYSSNRFELY
jgi:hypothetical protein